MRVGYSSTDQVYNTSNPTVIANLPKIPITTLSIAQSKKKKSVISALMIIPCPVFNSFIQVNVSAGSKHRDSQGKRLLFHTWDIELHYFD